MLLVIILDGCNTKKITLNEGFIEVSGGKVWYRIYGEGNKSPLLALHGGPGSSSYGLEPLKALSQDRPVILIDQLGCGRSTRITDTTLMTIQHYVEEVEQVRNALHLEDFYLFGQSWGTMLGLVLSFGGLKDLIIAIIIVAIIPGIVEEFFFRGLVQTQLQNILRNHHYAILVTAFLFSFFHFQFYSFIPKMVSGVLFGYMFAWSKNIVYPIAAHVTNNLIIVLGAYFWGSDIDPKGGSFTSILLLLPSIVITVMIILYLKNILTTLPSRADIDLKETEGNV